MLVALGKNTVTFASSSITIGEAINITLCLAPHTLLVLPHDMLCITATAVAQALQDHCILFIPPEMPQPIAIAVTQALDKNNPLFLPPDIPLANAVAIAKALNPHGTVVLPHNISNITAIAVAQALGPNRTLQLPPNLPQHTSIAVSHILQANSTDFVTAPLDTEQPQPVADQNTKKAKNAIKAGVSALLHIKNSKRNLMFQEDSLEQAACPQKSKKSKKTPIDTLKKQANLSSNIGMI